MCCVVWHIWPVQNCVQTSDYFVYAHCCAVWVRAASVLQSCSRCCRRRRRGELCVWCESWTEPKAAIGARRQRGRHHERAHRACVLLAMSRAQASAKSESVCCPNSLADRTRETPKTLSNGDADRKLTDNVITIILSHNNTIFAYSIAHTTGSHIH